MSAGATTTAGITDTIGISTSGTLSATTGISTSGTLSAGATTLGATTLGATTTISIQNSGNITTNTLTITSDSSYSLITSTPISTPGIYFPNAGSTQTVAYLPPYIGTAGTYILPTLTVNNSGLIVDIVAASSTNGSIPGITPPGAIMMWSHKSSGKIPTYWNICNGDTHKGLTTGNDYNTPNLVGQFIVGGTNDNYGYNFSTTAYPSTVYPSSDVSGGSAIMTIDQMPKHSHNYTNWSTWYNTCIPTSGDTIQYVGNNTGSSPTDTSGNSQPYYPPYYALCYIMYTP